MKDIIERLEKATGPDRIIDWEIHCRNGMEGVGVYGQHLKYTASIDAALTLVPERLQGSIAFGKYSGAILWERDPRKHFGDYRGANPAIALCIATLKARAAVSATPA